MQLWAKELRIHLFRKKSLPQRGHRKYAIRTLVIAIAVIPANIRTVTGASDATRPGTSIPSASIARRHATRTA
jgi:hypothetical protein